MDNQIEKKKILILNSIETDLSIFKLRIKYYKAKELDFETLINQSSTTLRNINHGFDFLKELPIGDKISKLEKPSYNDLVQLCEKCNKLMEVKRSPIKENEFQFICSFCLTTTTLKIN